MNDALFRETTAKFVEENGLLKQGDTVVSALSGGADSVAMLHVLFSLKEKYHLNLYAAHLNHMMRGEEAQRDEGFCRLFCERLGVELFTERADIPALSKKRGESAEKTGRDERYRFFQETADRLLRENGAECREQGNGAVKIATAHTLSDNAETVMLNLSRGAGISGLSGIPKKRGNIIRPLLCVTRAQVERYCEENGLSYVFDSTNRSLDYARNRVRLNVMPELKKVNAGVEENIMRLSCIMEDAGEILNEISEKELKKCELPGGYDCEKILAVDEPLRKILLKNIIEKNDGAYEHRHIALLEEAMRTGGAVTLPGGKTALCSQKILRVTGARGNGAESEKAETPLFDGENAQYISQEELKKLNKNLKNNCISCDIISENTVLRTRKPGDVFTDPRRNLSKTLKKLFNEMKIPAERRDSVRVVANGSEILWIEGIGLSKRAEEALKKGGGALLLK